MLTVQSIKANILAGKDFKTGNKKAVPSFTSNVNSFTNFVTNPLNTYMDKYYDANDDKDTWFNKMKDLAEEKGYAREVKEFKQNPENYKGNAKWLV